MGPGRPLDAAWLDAVGARSHFQHPEVYGGFYAARTADVDHYVLLAIAHGGPVLEIGCGNGRILLPIARAGLRVMGVDRSQPMLADLRARVRAEPALRGLVRVRRADMRTMRLGGRFPLVLCTFNTFLHLYTRHDAERFLARVRAHLQPGGRFVFDATLPGPGELARDPTRWFEAGREQRDGRWCRYEERFFYEPVEQILYVWLRWSPEDGGAPIVEELAQRMWFPAETEMLLSYAGFHVETVTGIGGGPMRDHLVWSCRA